MRQQVTWLHKPANLQMDLYKDEILALFNHLVPDINAEQITHFLPINSHALIREYCPTLIAKLTEWGLDKRLAECAFIVLPPNKKFAIHRDFPNWKMRNVGLLMPVINCENTYTAFYDAPILEETLDEEVGGNVYAQRSQRVDETQAVEIGRCSTNVPNWINVYQPHAPRADHDQYRVTFSVRFRPELFDLFGNGKFDADLVA